MGDFHQNIVIKQAKDSEVNMPAERVISYLIDHEIIGKEKTNNVLGGDSGHIPGENWHLAVTQPHDTDFLTLLTNGMEVKKGRTIFWADGEDFEKIACPHCQENNLDCDWGELFSHWMENAAADLICRKCGQATSISEYHF